MNQDSHQDTLSLDPQNPWLGLFSYTEDTRAYFHGRDEEAAELARRVQRKNLTILFGQSGLGKTSLLRAGLVPRLRPQGYCPVYVRVDYAPDSPTPAEQIKQAIRRETTRAGVWTRTDNTVEGESLWEFLHHRGDLLRDAEGKPLIPLLIFDQFEEVFTLAQADDAGRARAHTFLSDLADLVENRPPEALEARLEEDDSIIEEFDFARADYRILIALREDYLAHLESVKDLMPSITQNRMRLARMTGAQALSAVVEPGGKLVSREVAESIVRFVAGGSELANAEIEPSLLSLVCRELNNARIAQGRSEISADLLAGSRDTILSEFYERALADQPDGVRRVVEDELLTESGYRESLAEERVVKALEEAGAAPDALATLVNRRLLRIEDRLDMRRVELTHDVLCGVVMASRNLRHEREARDNAQRQLAEQKAREEAAHRAMLRARSIAAVCAVLMLVAIAGALFGWFNYHRAQAAEAQAQESRANAEKLVSFLIEDFYYELAPTGRLETLGKLARRTVAYYDSLPPGMVTTQSQINRAMALLREGQALQSGGNTKDSAKLFQQGHAVFESLWKQGNHSEPVAYGLALSLQIPFLQRGAVSLVRGRDMLMQAAALLKPFVEANKASTRTRLLYANILNYSTLVTRSDQKNIQTTEVALNVLKGIGALDLSNLDAAASYADTGDSQARALYRLGHFKQAQQVEKQAHDLAKALLRKRPGDLHAMNVRTISAQLLSNIALQLHDGKGGLAYAREAVRSGREEVHFNPNDANAKFDLLSGLNQLAGAQEFQGKVSEAIATLQQTRPILNDTQHPITSLQMILSTTGHLGELEANMGDFEASAKSIQLFKRRADHLTAQLPEENPLRQFAMQIPELFPKYDLSNQGKWQPLLDTSTRLIKHFEAIDSDTGSSSFDWKAEGLFRTQMAAANASLHLGHFEQAEHFLHEAEKSAPKSGTNFNGPFNKANHDVRLAWALAGQGKKGQARALLEPALDYYSTQAALGPGGPGFHQQYALALYVEALSQPDTRDGRKLRKEVLARGARMLASAPGEGPKMLTSQSLAKMIAQAQRAH